MLPAFLEGSPKLVSMSDPCFFQIIASAFGLVRGIFFVPLKKRKKEWNLFPRALLSPLWKPLWPSQPAVLGAPIPGIKPLGWGVPHEAWTHCSLGEPLQL